MWVWEDWPHIKLCMQKVIRFTCRTLLSLDSCSSEEWPLYATVKANRASGLLHQTCRQCMRSSAEIDDRARLLAAASYR